MKTEPKLGSAALIELVEQHTAHNYHPLPVVVSEAEGAWVTDVEGKRYIDMLSAYSALNFGHRHPALIAAARRSSTTSRSPRARSTTIGSARSVRNWPSCARWRWCSR